MKKILCGIAGAFLLALTGCETYNFSLPKNYNFALRDTPIVNVHFSVASDSGLSNAMVSKVYHVIDHHMRNAKRFEILKDNSQISEDADLHVVAYCEEQEVKIGDYFGYGYMVTIKQAKDQQGFKGESELAVGVSTPDKIRRPWPGKDVPYPGKDAHFTQALMRAAIAFRKKLHETYPISAKIKDFQYYEGMAIFQFPAGTNFGVTDKEEFVIGYRYPDGFHHVIALAKSVPGEQSSQLTVYAWNTDDPRVKKELIPRIKRGDKTLLTSGTLFAVARAEKGNN